MQAFKRISFHGRRALHTLKQLSSKWMDGAIIETLMGPNESTIPYGIVLGTVVGTTVGYMSHPPDLYDIGCFAAIGSGVGFLVGAFPYTQGPLWLAAGAAAAAKYA